MDRHRVGADSVHEFEKWPTGPPARPAEADVPDKHQSRRDVTDGVARSHAGIVEHGPLTPDAESNAVLVCHPSQGTALRFPPRAQFHRSSR